MTPKDLRWIGNWWLGVLVGSIICFLSSVFILGFPKNIKRQEGKRELKNQVEYLSAKEKLAQLPAALKRLLTNWTFITNSMGQNCVLMYAEGLAPFIAKILILRFGVAVEKVGNALTLCAVPPLISMY